MSTPKGYRIPDEVKKKMSDAAIARDPLTRLRRICPQGHDKNVTGKNSQGRCSICRNVYYSQNLWTRQGIRNESGDGFVYADFDRAYQIQQGKCAGCKTHQSELNGRLHVDHDHKTGKFRWLLCGSCNHLLGNARDNPGTLRTLADLLEARYGSQ